MTLTDHDLDAEIGAAMRDHVERMRREEREEGDRLRARAQEAARRFFRAVKKRQRRQLAGLSVAMFGIVLGCSWIAEQTLAGGM